MHNRLPPFPFALAGGIMTDSRFTPLWIDSAMLDKINEQFGLTFDDVLWNPAIARSCRPMWTSVPNSRRESASIFHCSARPWIR